MYSSIKIALFLFSAIIVSNAEFSAQDCRELGFIKPQLMCSSCDDLDTFGLSDIKDQCRECCQHVDISNITKKYPKAVLAVCTCKFGAYPQIQAFINSRAAKFQNLKIKYVNGLDPVIRLFDDTDNMVETLAINKWTTDQVEEYFQTHLHKEDTSYLHTNEL